jgi:hypothetical protein
MKPSTGRILTTHVGSLPRPHDLLDLMKAKLSGQSHDEGAYQARVRSAVADSVKKQVETGIDVVADGEQSKPGMAGADCGFSSQATYRTEVHPTVVWAKFEAMRDGARLASKRLWKAKKPGRSKKQKRGG